MSHQLIEKFRADYQSPGYLVDHVDLTFTLEKNATQVITRLHVRKNPESHDYRLILNGSKLLNFQSLTIDTLEIPSSNLHFECHDIYLEQLPEKCIIEIHNELNPEQNKALEGLYLTRNIYCSDCEPEGFRNITFFPDRPDIMATYTVTIIADKTVPVLLSNGNLIAHEIGETTHSTVWHDPFPKPSYLFALVAGDLAYIEDQHNRPDGTAVALKIYAEKEVIDQCHYALESLKRAMKWDEERFGLICDLDHYNIVAVYDFNGGAMENKGLNIFNAKYVLANKQIATDEDFETIESIIGHEYFHNWTGNRVTCRDWFQLSLKEGLTVFRDQEFTGDLHHHGLKRIDDVKRLRTYQFAEDKSALSHPVRPESYVEMRNFYTTTIYEKGAEVVRLYQTLLGKEGFKKGLLHYLHKFDGTAATCDDFLHCMSEANQKTLEHFDRWYSQAGTPTVTATSQWISAENKLILQLTQSLPDTPNQKNKRPQIIPVNTAIINSAGHIIQEMTLLLQEFSQDFTFDHITERPVISLLRNFSAPVNLFYSYSATDLVHIIRYEQDDFARWEAMQTRVAQIVIEKTEIEEKKQAIEHLCADLVIKANDEPAFFARLLKFPDINYIGSFMDQENLCEVHAIKKVLEKHLAITLEINWLNLYQQNQQDGQSHRALKNIALYYLAALHQYEPLVSQQFEEAENMTDCFAALSAATQNKHAGAAELLSQFYNQYAQYPSVIDKWFSLQAANPEVEIETLNRLITHPAFSFENPNRVRSVLGAFGQNKVALLQNMVIFGQWLMDHIILLDGINPQGAARLAAPFAQIGSFPEKDQKIVKTILHRALQNTLSSNLTEQLSKSL